MAKSRIPRLCITSPWNYPLFHPESHTHFGGWEVRLSLIARELARRGNFQVALVVGDHGQPHTESIEGVQLYSWIGRTIWGIPPRKPPASPSCAAEASRPGLGARLRGLLGRKSSSGSASTSLSGRVGPYVITPEMISIYDEVDADIYLVPGNSQFSAEAAFYCRERRRNYVFLSGSDFDYFPEYKLFPDRVDMYSVPHALKLYSIENAALHIVQNEHQAHLLESGYGRSSVLIKNPIDIDPLFPRNPNPSAILWVGKSDERIKRPSMILDLARHLPQFKFVIIMTFSMQETHTRCLEEAATLPNVTILERVPFERIESYFAEARLHLNTSVFEGFPNTFLQASKYGVPTVSLQVDPGAMLSQHSCGIACNGDLEAFKNSVMTLMTDESLYTRFSRQALTYVSTYHDKNAVIPRYERALSSILPFSRQNREPSHSPVAE